MLPELFQIGPLTLHTYGLMVALGILAGISLAEYLNRKQGGEPGQVVDVALLIVLFGLAGSRVLFVMINIGYFRDNPLEAVMIWKGGLVFFGGLLGGIVGVLLAIRIHRLPTWRTLDVMAAGMAIGHALGRLGCFSAGCCYGRISEVPWAVVFTDPRCLATDVLGESVHPTQLYSFLFLAALTGFLVWTFFRRSFDGQITVLYVGLYSLFRFTVEFFRGDLRGSVSLAGLTLSTSQVVSLVLLPAAIFAYWALSRRRV